MTSFLFLENFKNRDIDMGFLLNQDKGKIIFSNEKDKGM